MTREMNATREQLIAAWHDHQDEIEDLREQVSDHLAELERLRDLLDELDRLRLEGTRLRAELDEQRLVNSVYRLAIERLVPDEDERFQAMLAAEREYGTVLDPDDIQWWLAGDDDE